MGTGFDVQTYIETQDDGRVKITSPSPENSIFSHIIFSQVALRNAGANLDTSIKNLAKKRLISAAFAEAIISAHGISNEGACGND